VSEMMAFHLYRVDTQTPVVLHQFTSDEELWRMMQLNEDGTALHLAWPDSVDENLLIQLQTYLPQLSWEWAQSEKYGLATHHFQG